MTPPTRNGVTGRKRQRWRTQDSPKDATGEAVRGTRLDAINAARVETH